MSCFYLLSYRRPSPAATCSAVNSRSAVVCSSPGACPALSQGASLSGLRKGSFVAAALLLVATVAANAQGVLSVTPGRTAGTSAGTGTPGYSGDGGAATSATLANPGAVAYDSSGNLFVADTNNHVIREVVKSSGTIVTVAGSGTAGFSGDGGPAANALLDTPTGIAIDSSGVLFIADSHNHRVRRVANGVISTVAGNGTAGFSGDNGASTSAQLSLPSGVAVDASGTLYIADTNNQRIRRVSGTTITTLAGNGEQLFAGDGGAAINASLDSPVGIAVDAAGVVYIADRHNHRVRAISPSGVITTVAGSGAVSFAGGFIGEGSASTAAVLSRPTGVSVDAVGNLYIADTNNQRVRQVSAGTIATLAGDGSQGFSADGGSAITTTLNAPRSAAVDANGSVTIADTLNQRLRSAGLSTLSFGTSVVGVPSTPQLVTLTNTGTAAIIVSAATLTGTFVLTAGGSCGAAPLTLVAGASCTESVAFVPKAAGAASGAVTFSGPGVATQSVLLAGVAGQATTSTTLTANFSSSLLNQPVTLTATIASAGTASGSITFFVAGVALGKVAVSGGAATLTNVFPAAGSYALTAVYSGDANFGGSTSATLTESVGDFNFALVPGPGGSTLKTVVPGQSAAFQLTAAPLSGPFSFPIALSATGLPPGATLTFSPSSISLGGSPASFTMTVQPAQTSASLHRLEGIGGTTLALVLVPFAGLRRRRFRPPLLCAVGFFSLAALTGLTGCGSSSGFFGQPQQTYTITIVGTASANGATLQHTTAVQLTVQ